MLPDPPVNVLIFISGARWVNVGWSIPFNGNRPINRVVISASSTGPGQDPLVFEICTMSTTYNISSGILPFTNYTILVVACNIIGCSRQSNPSKPFMTLNDSKQC